MNTYSPRYAQVYVVIATLLVFLGTPVFGGVTPVLLPDSSVLNSEARATVGKVVGGMIADMMAKGYRQPPISIVLVACTYSETGNRSEYSSWLEATIKEVLLQQEELGVMAKGVEENLEEPQRESYKAFSERNLANWMLRGSFVGEGNQVRVTLELVDLATSHVLMQRSLSTGMVYSAEGRTLALQPSEDSGEQAPEQPGTWVMIRVVPEGLRADIRILNALGQTVRQYSDSEGEQEKLAPGRYRLEATDRLGQYYPYAQDFVVVQARMRLEVSLKPRFGSLELRIKPSDGADVVVNGRKEAANGAGIWLVEGLKAGKYEVVASKELYRTELREVEVKEGERTQVEIVLEENKYRLEVTGGGGIGGRVIVNSVEHGNLPMSLDLPVGRTRVQVEPNDSRYKVWEKDVEPKEPGAAEQVSVVFVERTGTLEITTNPAMEASLRVREAGGAWRGIGSAPRDWKAMVGEYEVEGQAVIKGQVRSGVERVTIREGQVTRVRIQLMPTTSTTTTTPSSGRTTEPIPVTTTTTTIESPMSMVWIPAGSFLMGSESGDSDEKPVHQVTLSSFQISKYEVTVGEFREFVNATGYRTEAEREDGGNVYRGGSWTKKPDANWKNPYFAQEDRSPVVVVSWNDVVAYCNWLSKREGLNAAYEVDGTRVDWNRNANGYRLPTEAEWEYAARGGNGSPGNYTYSGSNDIGAMSWYTSNSGGTTHTVGTRGINGLGLYDMSGNVWEWCWDSKGSYSSGSQAEQTSASSDTNRVARGGSWSNDAIYCRSTYRNYSSPAYSGSSTGFRLARRP